MPQSNALLKPASNQDNGKDPARQARTLKLERERKKNAIRGGGPNDNIGNILSFPKKKRGVFGDDSDLPMQQLPEETEENTESMPSNVTQFPGAEQSNEGYEQEERIDDGPTNVVDFQEQAERIRQEKQESLAAENNQQEPDNEEEDEKKDDSKNNDEGEEDTSDPRKAQNIARNLIAKEGEDVAEKVAKAAIKKAAMSAAAAAVSAIGSALAAIGAAIVAALPIIIPVLIAFMLFTFTLFSVTYSIKHPGVSYMAWTQDWSGLMQAFADNPEILSP